MWCTKCVSTVGGQHIFFGVNHGTIEEDELLSGLGRYRDNVLKKCLVDRNKLIHASLTKVKDNGGVDAPVLGPPGALAQKDVYLGPSETPYEGGVFQLAFSVPEQYPLQPPQVRFLTKIFHPNVHFKIYAASITVCIVFGFMFIAFIWKFDFYLFMVLIIAILNDGDFYKITVAIIALDCQCLEVAKVAFSSCNIYIFLLNYLAFFDYQFVI
ncbi:hypothetical protein L1987_44134 [Smallanthus sonchifolius]|uniref:Uncharacterized protein n=1 Tax=Smallanthus sonchifolius TaxID=185202 RepID=A0ACB9GNH0_9ASTR|nr:hypothetical protein L1987_44134 [Smallanthus sonchifolius]